MKYLSGDLVHLIKLNAVAVFRAPTEDAPRKFLVLPLTGRERGYFITVPGDEIAPIDPVRAYQMLFPKEPGVPL